MLWRQTRLLSVSLPASRPSPARYYKTGLGCLCSAFALGVGLGICHIGDAVADEMSAANGGAFRVAASDGLMMPDGRYPRSFGPSGPRFAPVERPHRAKSTPEAGHEAGKPVSAPPETPSAPPPEPVVTPRKEAETPATIEKPADTPASAPVPSQQAQEPAPSIAPPPVPPSDNGQVAPAPAAHPDHTPDAPAAADSSQSTKPSGGDQKPQEESPPPAAASTLEQGKSEKPETARPQVFVPGETPLPRLVLFPGIVPPEVHAIAPFLPIPGAPAVTPQGTGAAPSPAPAAPATPATPPAPAPTQPPADQQQAPKPQETSTQTKPAVGLSLGSLPFDSQPETQTGQPASPTQPQGNDKPHSSAPAAPVQKPAQGLSAGALPFEPVNNEPPAPSSETSGATKEAASPASTAPSSEGQKESGSPKPSLSAGHMPINLSGNPQELPQEVMPDPVSKAISPTTPPAQNPPAESPHAQNPSGGGANAVEQPSAQGANAPTSLLPPPVAPATNEAQPAAVAPANGTEPVIQPPVEGANHASSPQAAATSTGQENHDVSAALVQAKLVFEKNNLSLTPSHEAELGKIVDALKANPARRIRLDSYATVNEAGIRNDARRRSLDRAMAVRTWVLNKGIAAANLDIRVLGDVQAKSAEPDRMDIFVFNP